MTIPPPDTSTFKLLLIGDSGTGKSSLLLRFTDDAWVDPEETRATIGVDFKVKVVEVDGRRYKLTIWDTAGQERFRTLTSSYYRGAQGVVLVYDITNRASFDHLTTWFTELETYSTTPSVVTILVGNKLDRVTSTSGDQDSTRQVSRKEGEAYARKMSAMFIETSARTRQGVRETFEEVVRKIIETPSLWQKMPRGVASSAPGSGSVTVTDADEGEEGGSYCAC